MREAECLASLIANIRKGPVLEGGKRAGAMVMRLRGAEKRFS
jgi:hypothetical protein